MNSAKVKAIAGVVVVFALGACVGVLGANIVVKRSFRQFSHTPPEERKPFFMRHLTRELNLTEAQKPQVDTIIEETGVEIRRILHASQVEIDKLMEQQKIRLNAVLTQEQQQKLAELFERARSRWQQPPPPHPPGEPDPQQERDRPRWKNDQT